MSILTQPTSPTLPSVVAGTSTMRKKVDSRVRTLIENGVKLRHRSLFIIVGDAGREQVVNLHYMLSKAVVKARDQPGTSKKSTKVPLTPSSIASATGGTWLPTT